MPSESERAKDLLETLVMALNPLQNICIGEISNIADYAVPFDEESIFSEFIIWTNTRPGFIFEWRNDNELEINKYSKFMNYFDSLRSSFFATHYHLEKICKIENEIIKVLKKYNLSKMAKPGHVSMFGRTRAWNYEYQAYIFQFRACLQYLANLFSIYFDVNTTSFVKFHNIILKFPDNPISADLEIFWNRAKSDFKFAGEVRDKLTHQEAIPAAFINVTSKGAFFVGGGEKMRIGDKDDLRSLGERLKERTVVLQKFLADCLAVFPAKIPKGIYPEA